MANGQALFPPLRSKYLSKYLFLSPSLKVSSWKHRAALITSEEEPSPIFPKPWARARYPWKKSLTRANASLREKTIGKAYCSPCHNTSPTLNHFQVLKQCLCPPCPFSGWNRKALHFIWSCLETTHTTCLPWRTEVLTCPRWTHWDAQSTTCISNNLKITIHMEVYMWVAVFIITPGEQSE